MNLRFYLLSIACIIVQSVNWAIAEVEFEAGITQEASDLLLNEVVGTYSVVARGFDVGELQTTIVNTGNHYEIRTSTLPNQIVSLFTNAKQFDQCRFKIGGDNEIEPLSYQSNRTGNAGYNERIEYDISEMTVSYDDGSVDKIPAGYILDNCNFYFAVARSKGEGAIANQVKVFDAKEHRTRKFKTFNIEPDTISTKFGDLSTQRISMARTDAKNRTIKFWIAEEYPELPVRIEDERKGKVTVLSLEKYGEI